MEFIRGEDRNQTTMLPESVDEYVGENNPARVIDAYIDSLNWRDKRARCRKYHRNTCIATDAALSSSSIFARVVRNRRNAEITDRHR